jgi:hypothetical protein
MFGALNLPPMHAGSVSDVVTSLVVYVLIGAGAGGALLLFLRAYGRVPRRGERIIEEPSSPEWLTPEQAAQLLDMRAVDVVKLASRAEIPYYVIAGHNRTKLDAYRFRAEELESWSGRYREP